MPKYLATHTLPKGMSREQVQGLSNAAQEGPDCLGERSFLNLSEGKGACVWTAPSAHALAAWFGAHGVPYDDIYEIELEGHHAQLVAA